MREPHPLRVFINPCKGQAQRTRDWLSHHIDRDFLLLSVDRCLSVKPRSTTPIGINSVSLQVEKDCQRFPEHPASGTSRTHGARRSTNFLLLGTDMAEQCIATKLSVLQAWYHLGNSPACPFTVSFWVFVSFCFGQQPWKSQLAVSLSSE